MSKPNKPLKVEPLIPAPTSKKPSKLEKLLEPVVKAVKAVKDKLKSKKPNNDLSLEKLKTEFDMKINELTGELNTLTTTVSTIGTGIAALKQKVTELEASLSNSDNLSPETISALEDLKGAIASIGNSLVPNPDVPVSEG